jgi:hypothetical protein
MLATTQKEIILQANLKLRLLEEIAVGNNLQSGSGNFPEVN